MRLDERRRRGVGEVDLANVARDLTEHIGQISRVEADLEDAPRARAERTPSVRSSSCL